VTLHSHVLRHQRHTSPGPPSHHQAVADLAPLDASEDRLDGERVTDHAGCMKALPLRPGGWAVPALGPLPMPGEVSRQGHGIVLGVADGADGEE